MVFASWRNDFVNRPFKTCFSIKFDLVWVYSLRCRWDLKWWLDEARKTEFMSLNIIVFVFLFIYLTEKNRINGAKLRHARSKVSTCNSLFDSNFPTSYWRFDSDFEQSWRRGGCVDLRQCGYLYNLLQKPGISYEERNFLRQSQCAYFNNYPWVNLTALSLTLCD